ncbi:hypothetical protein [Albidovulum sp.]
MYHMSGVVKKTDFIARVRSRVRGEDGDAHGRAHGGRRIHGKAIKVTVTRDGRATEELIFIGAPTLGQIAERAGADAYILSIEIARHNPALESL